MKLLALLPRIIHVRSDGRLTTLAELVGEEARAQRPGNYFILAHLLEVLFIEALRSTAATIASPGLVRGLADERIAVALRGILGHPERSWTVERLARESSLSRLALFDRFQRAVAQRRWNILCLGESLSQRIYLARAVPVLRKWPGESVIALPTCSAWRFSAMLVKRPLSVRGMGAVFRLRSFTDP